MLLSGINIFQSQGMVFVLKGEGVLYFLRNPTIAGMLSVLLRPESPSQGAKFQVLSPSLTYYKTR